MASVPAVKFPQSPLLDKVTGRLSREWQQWLLNPQFTSITFAGVIPVESGGTGIPDIPNAGEILIGNGAAYALYGITGDVSLNALGVTALDTVNPNPGAYGSAATTISLAADEKGRIVAITENPIEITLSNVSDAGTMAAENANNVAITGGKIDGTQVGTVSPNVGIFVGVSSNSDAAAGIVGQYIESIVASGSAVGLTTSIPTNVTTIALTPGDWEVSGWCGFLAAATTTASAYAAEAALTSATFGTEYALLATAATAMNAGQQLVYPSRRISTGAPITVYLVASCNFAVSTMGAYGRISARRMR